MSNNESKYDYTIGLSAKGFQSIEEVKELLGLPSNEDVSNLAYSLLLWAISKTKAGEMIGSINEKHNVTRVNIEDLEKLRLKCVNLDNKDNNNA